MRSTKVSSGTFAFQSGLYHLRRKCGVAHDNITPRSKAMRGLKDRYAKLLIPVERLVLIVARKYFNSLSNRMS